MTSFVRKVAFFLSLACLVLALGAAPTLAKTAHHKNHKHHTRVVHQKVVHQKKADKDSSTRDMVRIAQGHLARLGYYVGKIDGKLGSGTKAAIKTFQREHSLKADGVLGSKTRIALENADHVVLGRVSVFVGHDNGAPRDTEVNQDFGVTLNGGTKIVSSRFARLDVTETGQGAEKRYVVNLNGEAILTAEGQPSVVGVSPTYDLGEEDAVILTTYSPDNVGCIYKNRVLAMNKSVNQLLEIENCTRGYQARIDKGSLYISFPEHDDNRAVGAGATWRLEGTSLERL